MLFTEMLAFCLNTLVTYGVLTIIFEQNCMLGLVLAILQSWILQGTVDKKKIIKIKLMVNFLTNLLTSPFPNVILIQQLRLRLQLPHFSRVRIIYLQSYIQSATSSIMVTVLQYSSMLGGLAFFILIIAG